MHLRLRNTDISAKLGLIEEAAEAQTCGAHQAPEVSEVLYRSQRLEIALEISLRVTGKPQRTPFLIGEFVRWDWEATETRSRTPIFSGHGVSREHVAPSGETSVEKVAPDAHASQTQTLAACERPERDMDRTPGERLTNALHHEQVCRSRENKAARFAWTVLVHRAFNSDQKISRALHLVEHESRRAGDHRIGISIGLRTEIKIIQGEIRAIH
jgi:hypothetical protein